ncbi:hypothetical protein [Fluviicola sp.]|jgi:hypothetical protein|uniref:hypothetical protein n=1 Tax=Fluviicola sp. TaxID=1917219 RepID=UPI0028226DB7|nr:hypothetical protein [Fluviicola sp.]MDR0802584.1 hypothetical protein [Fluviicola sp.]
MYKTNPFAGEFLALGVGILLLYLIILAGVLLLAIFYYKTFIDTMSYIRPQNRLTGVANVLFMWIPLFNLVYGFIVYPKICDSIKNEYRSHGLSEDGDFGKSLAITMCALSFGAFIPLVNFIAPLAILIVWIIFWVKINGYKETLMQKNAGGFSSEAGGTISVSSDLLD